MIKDKKIERIKLSKDISKQNLIDYGFTFSYPNRYKYRAVAYKYKQKLPLIFLEFTVFSDIDNKRNNNEQNYIYISCVNRDGSFYRPYYDPNYIVKNEVLKKVKATLNKTILELNKHGITPIKVRRKKKGNNNEH